MYYMYILKKGSGEIYIGYTNDLKRRITEHKEKVPKHIKISWMHKTEKGS